jgi:hypothetical protein
VALQPVAELEVVGGREPPLEKAVGEDPADDRGPQVRQDEESADGVVAFEVARDARSESFHEGVQGRDESPVGPGRVLGGIGRKRASARAGEVQVLEQPGHGSTPVLVVRRAGRRPGMGADVGDDRGRRASGSQRITE